jgi:ribosomal protein L24E
MHTKIIVVMNPIAFIALLLAICAYRGMSFHPGSGIVVDRNGQVFISDLSRGLLKIDTSGKVTTINREGGHWLALDERGSFSQVDLGKSPHSPRWFKRRTPSNSQPTLLTDGGSPLLVGRDGNIYFVCNDEKMIPGGLQIGRVTPDGKESLLNPALAKISEQLGGIKGLAQGPDGSLYASYPKAILKISLGGAFTNFLNPVIVTDCDLNVPSNDAPFLTGLTVDTNGDIYAAATGCGCVIKITTDGKVTTILKAQKPWAPTGVALHSGAIYVLEHVNPNSIEHEDWQPRVRKIGKDKKVSTLATIR